VQLKQVINFNENYCSNLTEESLKAVLEELDISDLEDNNFNLKTNNVEINFFNENCKDMIKRIRLLYRDVVELVKMFMNFSILIKNENYDSSITEIIEVLVCSFDIIYFANTIGNSIKFKSISILEEMKEREELLNYLSYSFGYFNYESNLFPGVVYGPILLHIKRLKNAKNERGVKIWFDLLFSNYIYILFFFY
jgi:hypothetical protein